MWPFTNKSTLESTGVFRDFTDWHSHILPGVDDGISDTENALKVLECYKQLGIREVWLTPHVMEDIPNATIDLQRRFGELLSAYKGPVQLHLAAEYMLDNGFEERLRDNDLLCIGNPTSRTILVETSYFSPPMNLYGTVKRISDNGYRPLLAHPERYLYMEMEDYRYLAAMGVLFQCNITSLVGAYGKEACSKFKTFLEKGWIQVLGTDIHNLGAFNREIEETRIHNSTATLLSGVANSL